MPPRDWPCRRSATGNAATERAATPPRSGRRRCMYTSRPIEVEGRFLGVAIAQDAGPGGQTWRFIATDPAVEELDGASLRDPAEARRIVGQLLHRGRERAG